MPASMGGDVGATCYEHNPVHMLWYGGDLVATGALPLTSGR